MRPVNQAPSPTTAIDPRALLAAIVESTEDAIASKDLNGYILSWNQGAERILGYTAKEAVGKHISMLIPPDLRGEEDEILATVRAGRSVSHYETRRRRKDGTIIDISLTVSPILDEAGRIIGASKIARDISEQKSSQRALADLNVRLEERVRERTRELNDLVADLEAFNAAVSHDLRTPLRAITGFARLMLGDPKLTEGQRRNLAFILESSTEMTRITEALLKMSRLQKSEVQRTRVDLAPIAEKILARLRAQNGGRELIARVDPFLVVEADATLAESVLENLIGNAWKFTSKVQPAQIHVGQAERGGAPCFFVRDNGVGFSDQEAASLFRPFHRLRPKEFEGTGIGLATVQRIVRVHGGRLEAEGAPGEGATMWFSFGRGP